MATCLAIRPATALFFGVERPPRQRADGQHTKAALFDAERKIENLIQFSGAHQLVLFPAGGGGPAFVVNRLSVGEYLGERHFFGYASVRPWAPIFASFFCIMSKVKRWP